VKIDLEQIRSLLDVVGSTDITELTIESGEEKITIRKQQTGSASTIELPLMQHQQAPAMKTQALKAPALKTQGSADKDASLPIEEESNSEGLIPITSPMVGTFYRSRSPAAPPVTDIGDVIAPGQIICIIEAMKLMNDMPSEVSGRIVKICVENGTTVEYGQPLFMVNPKV
jgi:acetyl-CoA carboxylase biotin carboxyl carrier protein